MSSYNPDPHPHTPEIPYSSSGSKSHNEQRNKPVAAEVPRPMPTYAYCHTHTPNIPHNASNSKSDNEGPRKTMAAEIPRQMPTYADQPPIPHSVSSSVSLDHYERLRKPMAVEVSYQMSTNVDSPLHTPDIPHNGSGYISQYELQRKLMAAQAATAAKAHRMPAYTNWTPHTPDKPHNTSGSISHYEQRHKPMAAYLPHQMPVYPAWSPHASDKPHSSSGSGRSLTRRSNKSPSAEYSNLYASLHSQNGSIFTREREIRTGKYWNDAEG